MSKPLIEFARRHRILTVLLIYAGAVGASACTQHGARRAIPPPRPSGGCCGNRRQNDETIEPMNLKPGLPKYYLVLTAGLLWNGVGLLLCGSAFRWLAPLSWIGRIFLTAVGIGLSLPAYRYGFKKIVRRNLDRLALLPDSSCLFAFQAWKSYLLVALMILIGFGLRHSALPKPFLAVVYLTIGAALIFAGGQYFKNRFKFD